ncbi:hypothetical protein QQ045_033240 [Rhodiola kirilowii]
MAVRFAPPPGFRARRPTSVARLIGLGVIRCTSSFSTPWSSDCAVETSSPKSEKKITDRLSGVIDAVHDRKLPPELRGQRNNIRSESDITNVVERRIWQSMLEGDFENLPGKGKPLDLSSNPHVDPAEDTLYRILSRNKCAPEWVELNKEIRSKVAEWRFSLKEWVHKCEGNYSKWDQRSEELKLQMRGINDMVCNFTMCKYLFSGLKLYILLLLKFYNRQVLQVFRYNLIVPFGRQMFGLKWEKELKLVEGI